MIDTKIVIVLAVAAVMFTAAIGPAYAIDQWHINFNKCMAEQNSKYGGSGNKAAEAHYCSQLADRGYW